MNRKDNPKARAIIRRNYEICLFEMIKGLFARDPRFEVAGDAEGYACFNCRRQIGGDLPGRMIIEHDNGHISRRGICIPCYSAGLDAMTSSDN